MHRLEFLPVARDDMLEIVWYVSKELKNPVAAQSLALELVNAAEDLRKFSYSTPVYQLCTEFCSDNSIAEHALKNF